MASITICAKCSHLLRSLKTHIPCEIFKKQANFQKDKMTKEHKHKTNGNLHKAITGDTEDNTVYAEANGMYHKAETEK